MNNILLYFYMLATSVIFVCTNLQSNNKNNYENVQNIYYVKINA